MDSKVPAVQEKGPAHAGHYMFQWEATSSSASHTGCNWSRKPVTVGCV